MIVFCQNLVILSSRFDLIHLANLAPTLKFLNYKIHECVRTHLSILALTDSPQYLALKGSLSNVLSQLMFFPLKFN